MKLTEVEKQEIVEAAKAYALQSEGARYFELKPTLRNIALQCSNEGYIAGATVMAEKKNAEIEHLKNTLNDLRVLNESLQREIKILDETLDKHLK